MDGHADPDAAVEDAEAFFASSVDDAPETTWYVKYRDCACCKGYIYGCKSAMCAALGVCGCAYDDVDAGQEDEGQLFELRSNVVNARGVARGSSAGSAGGAPVFGDAWAGVAGHTSAPPAWDASPSHALAHASVDASMYSALPSSGDALTPEALTALLASLEPALTHTLTHTHTDSLTGTLTDALAQAIAAAAAAQVESMAMPPGADSGAPNAMLAAMLAHAAVTGMFTGEALGEPPLDALPAAHAGDVQWQMHATATMAEPVAAMPDPSSVSFPWSALSAPAHTHTHAEPLASSPVSEMHASVERALLPSGFTEEWTPPRPGALPVRGFAESLLSSASPPRSAPLPAPAPALAPAPVPAPAPAAAPPSSKTVPNAWSKPLRTASTAPATSAAPSTAVRSGERAAAPVPASKVVVPPAQTVPEPVSLVQERALSPHSAAVADKERTCRNLRKKLREITELEARERSSLSPDQVTKLGRKAALEREFSAAEAELVAVKAART